MPYFNFNSEDSDGPTPYSWRFGKCRRWHPDLDFLYEIKGKDGQSAWTSCLMFTDEEQSRLVSRPYHQTQLHPQGRTDVQSDTPHSELEH